MPLLLADTAWDVPRLREEAEKHCELLEQMVSSIRQHTPPGALPNPHVLDLGLSMLERSSELGRSLLRDGSLERAVLVALVNQLYEAMVCVPVFLATAQSPPRPFPSRSRPSR